MQPTLIAFRQCLQSWRQMLRLSLLALAALNPPAVLLAQNPAGGIKFEHLSLEQGFSQSSIYVILQVPHKFTLKHGPFNSCKAYDCKTNSLIRRFPNNDHEIIQHQPG